MKKTIFLFAALTVAAIFMSTKSALAQAKYGPIAGLNLSNLSGDDVDSDGMLIGGHVGAFFNAGITDFLMIEPQLLFSMKGAQGKSDDTKMNWIEVPVWVRYEMESGLNFNAGPYIGFLLSADAGDVDVKDFYKSTDFGLGAGIGYQMNNGLGFNLNYSQGLSSIGEDFTVTGITGQSSTEKTDVKTSCIKVSVHYMLGGRRD